MNLVTIEQSYSFRTNKDSGYKRPTVTVNVPAPSIAGAVSALGEVDGNNQPTNTAKMVLETIQQIVIDYVRGLVDADSEFDQAKLDALVAEGKISLEAIANLPKTERNVLSKEDLEEFAKDYIATMLAQPGAVDAKVKAAAGLFVDRFKRVAGQNDVLAVLQSRLEGFIAAASEEVATKHLKVLDYLAKKLAELLEVKVTADSL